MRDRDKDRSQEKARRRAGNDARCAVLKMATWARELRDGQSERSLAEIITLLKSVTWRLERCQDITVEAIAGARDCWRVFRDGVELNVVEPHACEGDALMDARTRFGRAT